MMESLGKQFVQISRISIACTLQACMHTPEQLSGYINSAAIGCKVTVT